MVGFMNGLCFATGVPICVLPPGSAAIPPPGGKAFCAIVCGNTSGSAGISGACEQIRADGTISGIETRCVDCGSGLAVGTLLVAIRKRHVATLCFGPVLRRAPTTASASNNGKTVLENLVFMTPFVFR